MRPPLEEEPHYPFYQHLLQGGRVLRDDQKNQMREILDLERLDSDAAQIRRYGWRDLGIEEIDHE